MTVIRTYRVVCTTYSVVRTGTSVHQSAGERA